MGDTMLDRIRRALILEPHPDDLVIGCGGLVQRLVAQGAQVHGLLLSDVPGTYRKIQDESGAYRDYAGADRMVEADEAAEILGVTDRATAFDEQWHHRLDAMPRTDLVTALERAVTRVEPDLVLVPARSFNQDHVAVHDAFLTVMRPHFYRGAVLVYETTMERDFTPRMVVPLTEEQLATKLRACAAYKTQLGTAPHLFSIETMETVARYRGREAYVEAAEAFDVLRGLWS